MFFILKFIKHIFILGKRLSMSSEMSDCGYATQVENPETVSTSSNEDDSPQSNT